MKAASFAALAMGALVTSTASAQLAAYNIPDDPAFVFLGVSPRGVANPGTLTRLGIELAGGINVDGRVQNGLAVSLLPTSLLGISPTLETYKQGRPSFWAYNTQLSVGTVRASGDSASTDLAAGLRTIFFGPDPYSNRAYVRSVSDLFDRCLARAGDADSVTMVLEERTGVRPFETRNPARPDQIRRPDLLGRPVAVDTVEIEYLDARGRVIRRERAVLRRTRSGVRLTQDTVRMWAPGPNTLDAETATDCAEKGRSTILKRWMKDHWNDAVLSIAGAAGTRFRNSELGNGLGLGYSVWALGALPLRWGRAGENGKGRNTNFGQIAGQLRYDDLKAAGDGATDRREWNAGVRLTGGVAHANGFVELLRIVESDAAVAKKRVSSWSAGVEYMVAQNLWLSTGIGERFSETAKADRAIVFLHLKWGIARSDFLNTR